MYEDYLFITQGDNHNGTLPQDTWALGSKVLAVDRDGAPMPTNVLGINGDGDPKIFAYGFRNVQGIAFRGDDVYICEHGPQHQDEVTRLVNGGNGGWDPHDRPDLVCDENDYCGYSGTALTMPMTDLDRFPAALRPVWDNHGQSEGMVSCTFLRGSQWGEYEGWLAVGFLFGQRIDLLDIDSEGNLLSSRTALQGKRFRSILNSPKGGITVATDNGELYEIDVATLTNSDLPSGPQCVYLPSWHQPVYGCTSGAENPWNLPDLNPPDFDWHYWEGCTCE
jgi:glucose/arabinose dehydrogenase